VSRKDEKTHGEESKSDKNENPLSVQPKKGLLRRQISDGSGTSEKGLDEGISKRRQSISSSPSSSGSTNGGNTASGNWGWFEDVHEQDGQETASNDKNISSSPTTTATKKNQAKKKGALLHFGDALVEPLNEIVESSRGA